MSRSHVQNTKNHSGGLTFPGSAIYSSTDWYGYEWADYADQIEWQIYVSPPTGAPTAGVLTAVFEILVPSVVAAAGGSPADSEQNGSFIWVPVNRTSNPDMFPNGDWPSPLIAYNAAQPVFVQRPIRTNHNHRLHIAVSGLAGGASPGWPITVRSIAS